MTPSRKLGGRRRRVTVFVSVCVGVSLRLSGEVLHMRMEYTAQNPTPRKLSHKVDSEASKAGRTRVSGEGHGSDAGAGAREAEGVIYLVVQSVQDVAAQKVHNLAVYRFEIGDLNSVACVCVLCVCVWRVDHNKQRNV